MRDSIRAIVSFAGGLLLVSINADADVAAIVVVVSTVASIVSS